MEQISPAGENCLMPTALAAKQGLAVAWFRSTDVSNAEGAIGQIHTLHMALRGPTGWRIVRGHLAWSIPHWVIVP